MIASSSRAATITVTTTADDVTANDGTVSLREAMTAINAGNNLGDPNIIAQNPGAFGSNDRINFNIAGSGVHTITPGSTLPTITKAMIIDGSTQPGSSANTNALNAGINAVLLIELNQTSGTLTINAGGAGTAIRGLVLNRGVDEIVVNANNVTIAGNFIGTNPAGTAAMPAASGGFAIRQTSGSNNVIGGAAPADRNLLSGDRQGEIIVENGNGTQILGNYIGTDITGTLSLILIRRTQSESTLYSMAFFSSLATPLSPAT
jgi:CSLREA domain-containing protein